MKLLDYMSTNDLTDEAMAERIGDCSASAVKKWKYGERSPDADRIIRIEEVTDGAVGLKDWAAENFPPAQAVAS